MTETKSSHRRTSLVAAAVAAIEDRKGSEIVALDLRGLSDAADYFIIASGTSDAHVRGIADGVVSAMADSGTRVRHIEGMTGGRWVLLDFADLVVHLFHPETRAYYGLERLWQDAPTIGPGA